MKSTIYCAKKIALLTICSFVFSFSIHARSPQEVVSADSWVFDSLARVVMDSGRTDFTYYAPMTLEQVRHHLEKIDQESLSKDAERHYDRLIEYMDYETPVSFGSDILRIQAEMQVSLDGFYKTEDDIDWVYDRYCQKPLAYIPVQIALSDILAMSMDVRLGQTRGFQVKNDNYCNIPTEPDAFDLNFPHDYYFAMGHKFTENTGVSFIYGTMNSYFNRSLSGSVTQSEYFTGSTYADLSIYSSNFRYKLDINQFNPDRYMYSHEIAAILWDKLQLTAKESLLVYAPLELRYLAPWNVYHGFAAWKDYETRREGGESNTCDYMSLKIDFTPVRNSRFYGIFVMDQFQMPTEADDPNDCTPRGFGFQAGTEVFVPYGEGAFHVWLEGTYTDPFMYIKASPQWSLVRYSQDLMGPKQGDFYTEWYGTPWGPDTVGGEIAVGYEAEKWSLTLDCLFKACGTYSGNKVFQNYDFDWKNRDKAKESAEVAKSEESIYKGWAYPSDDTDGKELAKEKQGYTTPHGTNEYVTRVSVRATATPVKDLEVMVQPSFTYIANWGNIEGKTKKGFEIAVSLSKKLF